MKVAAPIDRRASGILLHPTSLPGPGIGTIGRDAARFVDWLADAGQSAWQILPLVAVDEGGSPYNGLSAFAANPLLIDLDLLVEDGLLERVDPDPFSPSSPIDFPAVQRWKRQHLHRAFTAFREGAASGLAPELAEFRRRESAWLEDFALFRVLRDRSGGAAWTRWDADLRDRAPGALDRARTDLANLLDAEVFQQFLFERQWRALREHATRRGVAIIGDVPIFVAHDSADVWTNRDLFELDAAGHPTVVSGVPPDYFSETGQRWGNPLYRWRAMARTGYAWWVERFRRTLDMVDLVRIDHFRGFESYWEVPAGEETALNGRWLAGPGEAFFEVLADRLGPLPVIAEDLGLITQQVEELRDALGFPGMRVLQFAFDGDPKNPHLPANYPANSVAYTGTHDNDTVSGWWEAASEAERVRVGALIPGAGAEIHWALIRLVADSGANLAIVPAQDLLGLGSGARMNTPGTSAGNWSWRLRSMALLDPEVLRRLRGLTGESGRLSSLPVLHDSL